MAQKVQYLLLDDIDGSQARETVSFSLDGVNYEIDLNEDNAQALRDTLSHWIGHARKNAGRQVAAAARGAAGTAGRSARRPAVKGEGPSAGELRSWARANGFTVSDRGRISDEVREAYAAAH